MLEDLLENRYETAYSKRLKIYGDIFLFALILILLIVLVFSQIFRISEVSGWSMRNTIHDGDLVLLTSARSIDRGDIVTAETPNVNIIKRVVAVGGDKILFVATGDEHRTVELYIDKGDGFVLAEEPFIYRGSMSERGFNQQKFDDEEFKLYRGDISNVTDDYIISIGEGEYFLMGDNRDESRDSRHYGLFKKDSIFGKVLKRFGEGTVMYDILNFFYTFNVTIQEIFN